MKKLLLILLLIIIVIAVAGTIVWTRRSSIAAEMIHRHLGVPVSIKKLEFRKGGAEIEGLWIGNPPHFKSSSAFRAKTIDISTTLPQITGNPLTIDEIVMDTLIITLETRKNGETNWNQITSLTPKNNSERGWLIKKLTLRNLSIQVIQGKGQMKTFELGEMDFYNLSDQTGFPVSEIEKAIFNQVMKELFNKFNLQKLLQPLIPIPLPFL